MRITAVTNQIRKKTKWVSSAPILLLALYFSMASCISHSELINFQDPNKNAKTPGGPQLLDTLALNIPVIRIQANDVLDIRVFGADVEIAAPFNVASSDNAGNFMNPESIQIGGYLVNKEGFVDFPVLGKIAVAGLTTTEATEGIVNMLTSYLKNPVVRIRLLNFMVTVTGEVNRQGTFTIFNERISVPDALAMAEGLTDYANRKDVLIVRENNGKRILKRVNLASVEFFRSEYYYLKQNDMIYVEPIQAKRGAIVDQSNKTIPIISAIGTIIAVILALVK